MKYLISEDVSLTSTSAKMILKDLKKMRELGINPMDMRARKEENVAIVWSVSEL